MADLKVGDHVAVNFTSTVKFTHGDGPYLTLEGYPYDYIVPLAACTKIEHFEDGELYKDEDGDVFLYHAVVPLEREGNFELVINRQGVARRVYFLTRDDLEGEVRKLVAE